ncbi:SCP-like protein [Ancylostoma duodenale]|uniref:SCP-like protein n=1 Tax=Ancylostoma duodenale TaxID=51022 RepID=A0A0C2FWK7_9BILA|nr:SCP-like protein [Ancylostoma duodenale]
MRRFPVLEADWRFRYYIPQAFRQNQLTSTCKYSTISKYFSKDNKFGKLYRKGSTCSDCGADTCIDSLCEPKGYTPGRKKYEIAVIIPEKCPDDGMTKKMKTTAQNMHNYYRRLLATGWARNKQTVYAPIAAKMLAVTYNCTDLGKEAKNKSSDCRSDIGDPTPGRAMNKLEIKNYTMPLQDALELAITTWWNQVETEGLPADLKYTADMESAGKITNFVNMANENVDSVGCAVTQCKPTGVTRVVCEYNMAPVTDEVVYTKAKKRHCSDCKSINKACGKDYSEGLCV